MNPSLSFSKLLVNGPIGPLDEVFKHPVHPHAPSLAAARPVPDPKVRPTDPFSKGEIPGAIDRFAQSG